MAGTPERRRGGVCAQGGDETGAGLSGRSRSLGSRWTLRVGGPGLGGRLAGGVSCAPDLVDGSQESGPHYNLAQVQDSITAVL